jgi:hypothetical protein
VTQHSTAISGDRVFLRPIEAADAELYRRWRADNPRAQRAYGKAGFTREGTVRHDRYEGGRHTSGLFMSILRDEWSPLPRG